MGDIPFNKIDSGSDDPVLELEILDAGTNGDDGAGKLDAAHPGPRASEDAIAQDVVVEGLKQMVRVGLKAP